MKEFYTKIQWGAKIEEFLRDRMRAYDMFRLHLKDTKKMTTEEVYQEYQRMSRDEQEETPLKFPYYRDYGISFGASVMFTEEEKEKIFLIIREYLIKTKIAEYPNSGKGYIRFITDILETLLNNEKINEEQKEEICKLVVSLNCMEEFLFSKIDCQDFFGFEQNCFYIKDYTGKVFARCTFEKGLYSIFYSYYVNDFTPLNVQDYLENFKDYKRTLQSKKD